MDGDQVTVKGCYSAEANKELAEFMNSKAFYIDLGGKNVRTNTNESTQCLYNLTVAMKGSEISEPKFKTAPKFI